MALRLGEMLVHHGVISEDQRDAILDRQADTGRPFGAIAERLFDVRPEAIERAWAEQYADIAEHTDPRYALIDPDLLELIDRRQAWQFGVLPVRKSGGELAICTTVKHLPRALRFSGWRIGGQVYILLAEPEHMAEALERYYPMDGMSAETLMNGFGSILAS